MIPTVIKIQVVILFEHISILLIEQLFFLAYFLRMNDPKNFKKIYVLKYQIGLALVAML